MKKPASPKKPVTSEGIKKSKLAPKKGLSDDKAKKYKKQFLYNEDEEDDLEPLDLDEEIDNDFFEEEEDEDF